jgi:hypothetical protein
LEAEPERCRIDTWALPVCQYGEHLSGLQPRLPQQKACGSSWALSKLAIRRRNSLWQHPRQNVSAAQGRHLLQATRGGIQAAC